YLPVSLTGNFGMQVGNPLPLITDFYDAIGVSHPPNVAVTSHPFGESVFEPSPLNRVLEQAGPGESWRSTEAVGDYSSTDRTVKFAYETNGEAEVRLWTYTYPTTSYPLGLVQAGTVSAPVYYEPNQLHKTKTKDEQYNEVIEYKDKEGRVVLKRVQAVPGNPA